MLFVGLHITKCAGTSFALHVRNKLPPHKWYLCSGFRDMERLAVTQLAERIDFANLQFVFGHFIHESLFSVAGNRRVFLFTGIRSPVERAVSEFYHMCNIRLRQSKPPLSADEFFRLRSDTMCIEMLRAFPGVPTDPKAPLVDRAIEVAQMFDFVYESEDFVPSVAPLLDLMKIDPEVTVTANVRGSEAAAAQLEGVEAEIRARCPEQFRQDELLYDYLKPRSGKLYPFQGDGPGLVSRLRARREAEFRQQEDGFSRLTEHFAKYFVADYRNLDQVTELQTLLRRKEQWLNALHSHAARVLPVERVP